MMSKIFLFLLLLTRLIHAFLVIIPSSLWDFKHRFHDGRQGLNSFFLIPPGRSAVTNSSTSYENMSIQQKPVIKEVPPPPSNAPGHEDNNVQEYDEGIANKEQEYDSMPWKSSIKPGCSLTFMPYYTWTEKILHQLTNLKHHPTSKYHYCEQSASALKSSGRASHKKGARIINESYESDEYRKIRMTYYDAGETQVFNSLWYPRPELGYLPLLGIDLLQFHNLYLVVVDFQPIHDQSESPDRLERIWKEMPFILRGKMSDRFYDEDKFFSDHMLFGRFGKEEAEETGLIEIGGDLSNAVQKYISLHVTMVQEIHQSTDTEKRDSLQDDGMQVLERQRKYDIYFAERDRAHAMIVKMFGKEFADGYLYDFLFSLSNEPKLI
jgi:15,16-dihydrobiliverdin:ferredoxin oxidoreductase